jgi:hypothetical protein
MVCIYRRCDAGATLHFRIVLYGPGWGCERDWTMHIVYRDITTGERISLGTVVFTETPKHSKNQGCITSAAPKRILKIYVNFDVAIHYF